MHTSAVSSGQQTNNKINIVEIEKRNHGFGFNIVGGVDNNYLPGESGIFISRINEDSVAATRNVGLKKGDRIVSVNGQSFADLFHGEAVSILRSIPAQHRACMLVESAAERNIIYDHKNTITSLEVSKADMDDDMKVDQTTVDKVEDEAAENVGDSLETLQHDKSDASYDVTDILNKSFTENDLYGHQKKLYLVINVLSASNASDLCLDGSNVDGSECLSHHMKNSVMKAENTQNGHDGKRNDSNDYTQDSEANEISHNDCDAGSDTSYFTAYSGTDAQRSLCSTHDADSVDISSADTTIVASNASSTDIDLDSVSRNGSDNSVIFLSRNHDCQQMMEVSAGKNSGTTLKDADMSAKEWPLLIETRRSSLTLAGSELLSSIYSPGQNSDMFGSSVSRAKEVTEKDETEPIISAELVIEQTTEDPNSDSIHNLLLSRQANVNGTQPAMSDEVSVEEMVDSLYAELMADLVPQAVDDIDDLPPTPKRPFLSSIMDPKSPPSILTEILFVSFGLAAITLGSLIIYRYYKR